MSFSFRSSLLTVGLIGLVTSPVMADLLPAEFSTNSSTPAIPPPPKPPPSADRPPLYRDSTAYPPLQLAWSPSPNLSQVLKVYPHPTNAPVAVVTTQTGIFFTKDAGLTWNELPEAAVAKVGIINDVVFHPVLRDTFYLASQTSGIWITTDGGKTFAPVAGASKGMASDTVTSMIIYPGDPTHQTLLAVHGQAALGISCSRDGGQTWDVLSTDYHFSRLFGAEGIGTQLYLFGSTTKEPDIQSVYTCHTVGEFLIEVVRDVVPIDLVFSPVPWKQDGYAYVATSDSGLERIENKNGSGMSYNVKQLAYPGVDGWSSVGMTWGPSADIVNLYLYDPVKLGLIAVAQDLSNKGGPGDDLTIGVKASDGLPVTPLTKEGATLRPNSSGTVFYAAANGALSIGRLPDDVPWVEFAPGVIELDANDRADWRQLADALQLFCRAKGPTLAAATDLCQSEGDLQARYDDCKLTVTARVPIQPAPPASVTIDLSRYGGDPHAPLYDDGKHDDGAANDGVYGLTFAFLPDEHIPRDNDDEWRSHGPGRVAMGVVATYADGKCRGAVGVVDVLKRLSDVDAWGKGIKNAASTVEGGVTTEPFMNPRDPKQPAYAPRLHKGDVAVRLNISKGSWTVHFKMAYNKHDIDSCAAISFYLRLDSGQAPKEIDLQLRDAPEFSPPTTTERVPVLNGITLNADYQRIVIPMKQVIGTSQIQLDHLVEIIISGEADAPATLTIDGLQAIAVMPDSTTAKPTP